MVDVSSQNNSVSVNVSTSGNSASIKATPDMAQYYSEKSREWAVSNRIVDGVDYSSKYYANKANESATKAENAKAQVLDAKDGVIAEVQQEAQIQMSTIQEVSQLEQEQIQEVINRIEDGKAVYMGNTAPTDDIYTVWVSPEDNNFDLEIEEIKEKLENAGGGLEIGDIGFTQMAIDETLGKRRKLNGQIIIQEQYQQLSEIIKNSVALNLDLACTEEEWQSAVTMSTNGICYKYVIDDEAGTIRLPKYPEYFVGGLNEIAAVVGNGMTLGLTDGANNYGVGNFSSSQYRGIQVDTGDYGASVSTTSVGQGSSSGSTLGVTTDPTKSGIEAHLVQEKIKGTYFIQVATGSETKENVINEIELNNPYSLGDSKYVQVELNNVSWLKSNGQWNSYIDYTAYYDWILDNTNQGKDLFKFATQEYTDYDWVVDIDNSTFRLPILNGSECTPSKKYDSLELGATGAEYIAPANGFYYLAKASTSSGQYIAIANITANIESAFNCTASGQTMKTFVPVSKGDTVRVSYNLAGNTQSFIFVYAQGNGSLYYYVGETVQNANLINAGRIEEKIANCLTRNSINEIVSWGMPNYNAVTTLTKANGTVPFDGYLFALNTEDKSITFTIGNVVFQLDGSYYNQTNIFVPVQKGQSYSCSNWTQLNVFSICPLKGAN